MINAAVPPSRFVNGDSCLIYLTMRSSCSLSPTASSTFILATFPRDANEIQGCRAANLDSPSTPATNLPTNLRPWDQSHRTRQLGRRADHDPGMSWSVVGSCYFEPALVALRTLSGLYSRAPVFQRRSCHC